jgi:alpha-ketoglutarate-dependent taurine dioxygenase
MLQRGTCGRWRHPLGEHATRLRQTLPPNESYLDDLKGFHATDSGFIDYVQRHLPPEAVEKVMQVVGTGTYHPIARTHPETSRKALFVDESYVSRIEGLGKDEGRYLLDFLITRVNDVSIQCRFHWTEGAVAVWDERATQHSGSADHRGSARILRRCTIAGERPTQ